MYVIAPYTYVVPAPLTAVVLWERQKKSWTQDWREPKEGDASFLPVLVSFPLTVRKKGAGKRRHLQLFFYHRDTSERCLHCLCLWSFRKQAMQTKETNVDRAAGEERFVSTPSSFSFAFLGRLGSPERGGGTNMTDKNRLLATVGPKCLLKKHMSRIINWNVYSCWIVSYCE